MNLPPDSCCLLWVHEDGTKSHFHPSHLEGYREEEWSQAWYVTDDIGKIAEGPFADLLSASDWLVGGCDVLAEEDS